MLIMGGSGMGKIAIIEAMSSMVAEPFSMISLYFDFG